MGRPSLTRAARRSAVLGCALICTAATAFGQGQPPEREFVERITEMIRRSQFKRRLPVIAKLSRRTADRDFRYPRDWGTG